MTRLIDADVFERHLEDEWILHEISNKGLEQIGKWLAQEKTIDAVPVIRCKNCKHWDGYYCHNKWWGDGYGNYTPPIKKEDGFCDWAERKEE